MKDHHIDNIFILAAIIGIVFLAFVYRKRYMAMRITRARDKEKENSVSATAIADVCSEFILFADIFRGIYEPMYKASKGMISHERIKNTFLEWNIRIESINKRYERIRSWLMAITEGIDSLSKEELQGRALQIMDMIGQCGIRRDNRTELICDEETGRYYDTHNGSTMKCGKQLRVESPSWYINSTPVRIIEKGFCETI